jgi:type IV secretory pathway TrbD component
MRDILLCGGTRNIVLLTGSEASAARLSDKNKIKMKWLDAVA